MSSRVGVPLAPDTWATSLWPLGAHLEPVSGSVTFAVHAPKATRVVLELYAGAFATDAHTRVDCVQGTDGVWRARLGGTGVGALYAYRVWGPNWQSDETWEPGSGAGFLADLDAEGNRFNPNKVLFDPYARELTHNLFSERIGEAGGDLGAFGTGGDDYRGRPRREVDTAHWVPKGIVCEEIGWTSPKPKVPTEGSAIYEAHVTTLTKHPSAAKLSSLVGSTAGFGAVQDIPTELLGTYAGAAYMAPYLKALGMTAIELLPVHETNSSETAGSLGLANHWGYQTLSYFAPNREYAFDKSSGGPTREFKAMVHVFHDHDIEVYIDVVYNHSAEGGNWSGDVNTTGFVTLGGFATADYYVMTDANLLVDGATGCSNQLNFSVRATQRLVLDSLSYWTDVMGVDGFRFDLATVLGRTPNAFERNNWGQQRRFFQQHPLLLAIRDFAASREVEVIAEAWDLWGYEVGNFPAGWGEWNGRFRDAVRGYAKGDGNSQAFIQVFNGDYFHFNDNGGPQKSVNFITAHDGFTLADLVSYNTKVNAQPYPFGPSDGGSDANLSWDSGGDQALRRQRIRNFLTIMFMARGVPMIVSGDEYGRTQNGNNNPWNINTIGIWNNWAAAGTNAPHRVLVDPDHPEFSYHDNVGEGETPAKINPTLAYASYIAGIRQRHPGLRQRAYGAAGLYDDDVTYLFFRPDGQTAPSAGDRCLSVFIDCSSVGDLGDMLVMINMNDAYQEFAIPAVRNKRPWRRFIDTAAYAEPHGNHWAPAKAPVVDATYAVAPWSIAVVSNAPVG